MYKDVDLNEYLAKDAELGDRLRELRKNKKLTQEEVAFSTNINVNTISRYEKNTSHPTLENLRILSEFYKVSCDYLVMGINAEFLNIHEETGLGNDAIEWLEKTKKDPELIKMINTLLGNKTIADALVLSFYLYVTSDNITIQPSEKLVDQIAQVQMFGYRTLLRGVLGQNLGEILDAVYNLYFVERDRWSKEGIEKMDKRLQLRFESNWDDRYKKTGQHKECMDELKQQNKDLEQEQLEENAIDEDDIKELSGLHAQTPKSEDSE